jgi:hypothetical protein
MVEGDPLPPGMHVMTNGSPSSCLQEGSVPHSPLNDVGLSQRRTADQSQRFGMTSRADGGQNPFMA